jgi:hypothetical protein
MSKTNELSDAELEVVMGENGTAVVGLSVGNQTAIALNQELKAAYLAHQFGWRNGAHRRPDEVERKLDRIMEELRAPTAIGYSVGRGNRPRKD